MNILDDERYVSDEDFFSQIRLDLPALGPVRAAVEEGDWPLARRELARYFLERREPRWYFDWRFDSEPVTAPWDRRHTWGTPQLVPLEERAHALLDDVFIDGNGGKHNIADLKRFPKHLLRHGEKAYQIISFIWAADLGEMYARTRDNRFARKLVDIFCRFDEAFPRRVTIDEPNAYWLDQSQLPHWHLMNAGKAAGNMIITFYTGVLHGPTVILDDVFAFVKKFWFYAAQFRRFTRRGDYRHYNHHWYERGTCPFMFGLMFPEFEGFNEMRDWGREVINAHLERDFFSDGTYFEHSTCYNAGTLGWDLLMPWAAASANNFSLIETRNMARAHSWLRWVAAMTRPDGVLPAIGDEFDTVSLNKLARGAALLQDPELKGACLSTETVAPADTGSGSWLKDTSLGIEECLWPSWEHLPARPPGFASLVFPDGGWVVLKDSWQPDAMYLALSAINPPLGRSHGHWDMLSFLMFARGRSFIADPASWIYNGYFTAERRGYLYSMESHNVLTIDDDPLISKRALYTVWTGDVPKCTVAEWHLGEPVDFVSAYHDGYAPQRHTREVLFVKGDYWLVIDHVSNPEADWLHIYRQFLHFDFDVEVDAGCGVLTAIAGDEAMTIVPLALTGQSIRLWWDDYLEPERQKLMRSECPWVAEVRTEAVGPAVIVMLFYPHSRAEEPGLRLSHVSVAGPQGDVPLSQALALTIETPKGRDVWYRSFGPPRQARFGEFETAQRAWLRLERAGRRAQTIELQTVRRDASQC